MQARRRRHGSATAKLLLPSHSALRHPLTQIVAGGQWKQGGEPQQKDHPETVLADGAVDGCAGQVMGNTGIRQWQMMGSSQNLRAALQAATR